jgi:hypothetical protein
MSSQTRQMVFPFYHYEYGLLQWLLADLRPRMEQLAEDKCSEVFAVITKYLQTVEARIHALERKRDEHLRYHRVELDSADWWKDGSGPPDPDEPEDPDIPF